MSEGASPRRRWVVAGAAATVLGAVVGIELSRRDEPPAPARTVIGSGPRGAVFLEVAHDLARAVQARSPDALVEVRVTGASVDNLQQLAARTVDFGFVSLDSAVVDKGVHAGRVLAVARLYDSLLHLVVLQGSPVRSLADLRSRRVAVGADGSGTEFIVTRLLEAVGVRVGVALRLSQEPAMRALQVGTVDAAFTLSGTPTPAVTSLAAQVALRLVPLDDGFEALDSRAPGTYTATSVPEQTYPGVEPVGTVAVANLLVVRSDVPDERVLLVGTALLDPVSRRYWTHPESKRIDVRTAIATGSVPLHPVIVRWLRDHKP